MVGHRGSACSEGPVQRTSTYGLVGYDVRLTRGRSPVRSWVGVLGSLAQMVEHWSNKPRVMGSIPIGTTFCEAMVFEPTRTSVGVA